MVTVEVPESLDGVRVDKAVALLADLSRSAVDALIDEGRVQIDGTDGAEPEHRAAHAASSCGSTATTGPARAVPDGDPSVAFDVVYEDPDLIVVDKPAGLVVHPGAGHRTGTLVHGLLARFPELAGAGRGEPGPTPTGRASCTGSTGAPRD